MTTPHTSTQPGGIQDAPLSVKDWLITLIVLTIPFVGLIFLLYWALSNSSNLNRKNYCLAVIIYQIALSVLVFLIIVVLFSMGVFTHLIGEYGSALQGV